MTIIEDISSNSITTLHLSGDPDDHFSSTKEFVSALTSNTSLEEVIFDKDFLGCFFGSDRERVLHAIAALPNIQEVQLADVCLMVPVLTHFVQSAKCLRSFTMARMVLQGVRCDFDALESALLQKTTLKHFHVNDCIAANKDIDMDKIVNAGKNITATSIESPSHVSNNAIAA